MDLTLARGLGVAIAFEQMERCYPEEGWGDLARRYIVWALRKAQQDGYHLNLGLLDGLAGIAWVTLYVAGKDPGGQKILSRLDQILVKYLMAGLERWNASEGVTIPSHAYDLISGVAGISLYLVERKDEANVLESLAHIYDFLTTLVSLLDRQKYGNNHSRSIHDECQYPYTSGVSWNLGLAHGLPGVLVALARAQQIEFRIPALTETIHLLAR